MFFVKYNSPRDDGRSFIFSKGNRSNKGDWVVREDRLRNAVL
jgi:hypothetical protein